jgi:hypothetical protein
LTEYASDFEYSPALCVILDPLKQVSKREGRLRSQFISPGFISTLELSRNVRESRFWEDKHVGTQIRRQPEVVVTMLA